VVIISDDLKKKILEEMVVDYSDVLEKNFELAKKFIRITKSGKVDVLIKDKLPVTDQITLYLIGKAYTKEAGFINSDETGHQELMEELGISGGTLRPSLKKLRDSKIIKQIKRGRFTFHVIQKNMIEKILKRIDEKFEKE